MTLVSLSWLNPSAVFFAATQSVNREAGSPFSLDKSLGLRMSSPSLLFRDRARSAIASIADSRCDSKIMAPLEPTLDIKLLPAASTDLSVKSPTLPMPKTTKDGETTGR
ncbi:hypothetical protein ACLKA7_001736 [Drosophila subpalustris]